MDAIDCAPSHHGTGARDWLAISSDASKTTRIACVALMVAAFAYQLAWAGFASIESIVGNITCDDTFLYLEFARNTAHFGFPTFDGANATNGIQPIWGGILVVLGEIVRDPDGLIRIALASCAILNLATGIVLLRCANRLGGRSVMITVAGCWACYMLGLSPSMMGMENSLHALVAAIVVYFLIGLHSKSYACATTSLLLFGTLLALNAGVRLDSAIISLLLAMLIARRSVAAGRKRSSTVIALFGPMAAGAVGFVTLNRVWFGTTLPVSGMMKAFYADHYLDGMPPWLAPLAIAVKCLKVFFDVPEWIFSQFLPEGLEVVPVVLVCTAVLVPFGLILARSRLVDQSDKGSALRSIAGTLGIVTIIHLIILATSILQFSDDQWYHSWLVIGWIIWIAWAVERWMRSPVLTEKAAIRLVVLFAFALGAAQAMAIPRQLCQTERDDLHVERLTLSRWLSGNAATDTKVGAWNAGILAYFTDVPVVNLDGLMNSPEYARLIEEGGDVREAVAKLGINVLADYNDGDSTTPIMRAWNHAEMFRGIWRWTELVVLQQTTTTMGKRIYIVKIP